jgi:predicted metal-dependent peptidase
MPLPANAPVIDLTNWSIARMVLLDDKIAPYAAAIVMRLIPVPVPGIGKEIACDEEMRMYFDPAYLANNPAAVFAAVMAHEALVHLLAEHFLRSREKGVLDWHLWGLATDAAGNGGTLAYLFAAHPKALQPEGAVFKSADDRAARKACGWVWPETLNLPDGGTAEEYYDVLLDRKEKEQKQQQKQGGQGSKGQDSQGSQGQGSQQGQTGGQQGQTGGQQPQPGTGTGPRGPQGPGKGKCGSCSGDPSDAMEALKAKAREAHGGELPKGVEEGERATLRQEVAQAVLRHVQEKGQGSVPAGLVRTCAEMLKPAKVNWRRRLRTVVRHGIAGASGDVDWSMRRPRWRGPIGNPRLVAPKARVAVVADTSGSMGDGDLSRVLSEVKALIQSPLVERVWWVPTDAAADKVIRATDISHARNALIGGGGTDMGAGLETVAARCRPRPHLTIVITDGFTSWPDVKPRGLGRVLIVFTQSGRPAPAWALSVVAAD